MKTRMIHIIIISFLYPFFSSCGKEKIIRVPKASMDVNKTVMNVGDTIVFTNHSVAENVTLFFPKKGGEDNYVGKFYWFDPDNKYKHVFDEAGTYTATLTASNNQPGSPVKFDTKTITVKP